MESVWVHGQTPVSNPRVPSGATSGASEKLEAFRAAHSGETSAEQMEEMVSEGKQLLENMKLASNSPEGWIHFLNNTNLSKRSAMCVMWALMNQVAGQEKEVFRRGAIRVGHQQYDDKGSDAEKLEQFFLACSGAKFTEVSEMKEGKWEKKLVPVGGTAYPRISTHMKESRMVGSKQYGLDLPSDGTGALPAGCQTVLFGKLSDGTFYLKMEEHGVPPFWEKGFRTKDNFHEFVGHSINYLSSRKPVAKTIHSFKQISLKKSAKDDSTKLEEKPLPRARREAVPHRIKDIFEKFVEKKKISLTTAQIAEGKRLGISKMSSLVGSEHKEALLAEFQQTDIAIPQGYYGEVKGEEVLLASPF